MKVPDPKFPKLELATKMGLASQFLQSPPLPPIKYQYR